MHWLQSNIDTINNSHLRGHFDERDVFDVSISLVRVRVFGVRLKPHDGLNLCTDDGDQRERYEHIETEPPY